MFAKKILSIVGLFCLTQIKSVFAEAPADLTTCETAGVTIAGCTDTTGADIDTSSSTTYCENSGQIYAFSDKTCGSKLNAGVHAFAIDSKKGLIGVAETPADITKIVLYDCDGSKCVRTYGYVKINDIYYAIKTTGNEAVADTVVDCDGTTGSSGSLIYSSGRLCVDATTDHAQAMGDAGTIFAVTDAASTFTGTAINVAAVKQTANTFTLVAHAANTLTLNNGVEYCVNTSGEIVERASGYCDDECKAYLTYHTDTNYNSFTDTTEEQCAPPISACDLSATDDKNCNYNNGYYIASSGTTLSTDAGNGDLYKCTTPDKKCTKVDNGDIPIGYLVNSDSTHAAIPYIQCKISLGTTRQCSAIEVTNTSCADDSDTDVATPGEIFNLGGIKICLGGNKAAPVRTANSYFMVSTNALGIAAKTNNFVVLTLDAAGNAVLELKGASAPPKYKYSDTNKKISLTSEEKTAACLNISTLLLEYKLNKCEDGVDDEDLVYFYKSSNISS